MAWWKEIPWRLIQTNLRQIDMEDMDAKRFVADLEDFGATVVLLNTAGIIASYKTDLEFHFQSEYLHGDSLAELVAQCHGAGIRVIARTDFSKIRRPVFEAHPEWAYRTAAGEIVDYNGDVHACLNGLYQQEYLFKIISEAVAKTGVDGIFCNMGGFQTRDYSYHYHGICHCESCKRLFREESGLELPVKEDMADPAFRKYKVFQRGCVERHSDRLYKFVKAISPELAVNDYEIKRMESNTEYKRPLPHWQFSASSNTRGIRGTGEDDVVISNTTVDFIGFFYRHVAVSPELQALRLWQNIANLGGLDYYLIGRLDNHEDRSGYEAVRRVFRFHKEHERELRGLRSRAEALLIREDFFVFSAEERGWVRALTENHIQFDELRVSRADDASLEKYRVVILPDVSTVSRKLAARLDEFAAAGGIVVATGASGLRDGDFETRDVPLPECLGVERVRYVKTDMASAMLKLDARDKETFRDFTDCELIAIGDRFLYLDRKPGAEAWLRLIPPHQFGPPERCYYTQVTDIPGVSRYPYGKGFGVTIPWDPGAFFHEGGYDNTMRFLRGVLLGVSGLHDAAPSLTPMVEVTVADKPGMTAVQLVNTTGHFGTSYYSPVPVRDAVVTVSLAGPPGSVRCLGTPDNASYTYRGGELSLTVAELLEYEGVIVEY